MTSDNQIIEAVMADVETHCLSYRQLVRYVLEWLAKRKMLNVEQLKKDITLSGK